MPRARTAAVLGLIALAGLAAAPSAHAQTVAAPYNATYSYVDLGSAPGVPGNYGGVVISPDEPNTLLIGGSANGFNAAIYRVTLVRDASRQIIGFTGNATVLSTAPTIDGGLCFGPGGVLCYTGYSGNLFGQILQGSTVPDRIIELSPLGVSSSVGTVQFIPPGFPNAGKFIFGSYNASNWFTAEPVSAGDGTFTLDNVTLRTNTGGGPEGIIYVPTNSPLFGTPSVLVSEFSAGAIRAYDVDSNGAPNPATRRDFITSLSGAEGACLDPVTGQFIFATFGGGNRVIVIRGFSRALQCNAADIAQSDGSPGPDGDINNGDFQLFFQSFFVGCDLPGQIPCGPADIAGNTGQTNPDGQINNGDFQLFFSLFFQGCPV